jgi:hypothetical protein
MPQGLTQRRNNQMVRLLSSDFQLRYEPNFAWKSAASCYESLTGLRGMWPMSGVYHQAAGRLRDFSACGNHLTATGAQGAEPEFGYVNLIPYAIFDSSNSEVFYSTDAGAGVWADIIGNEAYMEYPGLTCMSWVYFIDPATGARQSVLSKWDEGGNDRSYLLERQQAGTGRFAVSTNGVAEVVISSTETLTLDTWWFLAGRFEPSANLDLFVNDTIYNNAAGVPATLNDSDANFMLGAIADPLYYLEGKESYTCLCASALSDAIILSVFNQTRAMFNV